MNEIKLNIKTFQDLLPMDINLDYETNLKLRIMKLITSHIGEFVLFQFVFVQNDKVLDIKRVDKKVIISAKDFVNNYLNDIINQKNVC